MLWICQGKFGAVDAAVCIKRDLIVTEVHLPFPPSVNNIWQHNKAGRFRVSRSEGYRAWIKAADNQALAFAQLRGARMITGHFTAQIILSIGRRQSNYDCDNRIKAVLDWAQSRRLIVNDSFCDRVSSEWGHAPHGCRLILREVA